ncbi:MAG: hypothetical protein RL442_2685 [Pseudomonadota bacterium]|jgi:hypothetical protein
MALWRGSATLASPDRLRKHPLETVSLSHPLAVQFTPEQVRWLDSRRVAGLTRSAVIRLVIEEAMRAEQTGGRQRP